MANDPVPAANIATAAVGSAEQLATLGIWKLADLIEDKALMAPPVPVLAPIAYSGRVTLISAREKVGKSTLLTQAARTLSTGGAFLGQRVSPGRVLWYSVDEPFQDTVQRFGRFGGHGENCLLTSQWPTPEHFRDSCQATKPMMVVIDTLGRLAKYHEVELSNANAASRLLHPLIETTRACGSALVLLHHTGKEGREYSGSVAIGADVDAPLTMQRYGAADEGGDGDADDEGDDEPAATGRSINPREVKRLLAGMTRWGEVRLLLRLENGAYVLNDPVPRLMGEIAALLKANPDGLSGNTLLEQIGGKKQTLLKSLRIGAAEGQWFRDGRRWRLKEA